jgi:hypothetical protein
MAQQNDSYHIGGCLQYRCVTPIEQQQNFAANYSKLPTLTENVHNILQLDVKELDRLLA